MKYEDILKSTGGEALISQGSVECRGVSIDTRTISPGDLFVAIRGAHFDGHDFVQDAVDKGAAAVVMEKPIKINKEVPSVKVESTEKALGDMASWWRGRFKVPCVAITGSNGKSTTKEMISAIAGSFGQVLKTEGNFNNLIGLPLTVFRWTEEHKAAVLEMGMNAPGEIRRLTSIADPDIGVVTNVTAAHLEKLRTVEEVAKAKAEIFEAMNHKGTAVINDEDPFVRKMGEAFKGRVVSYGMRNDSTVQFRHMVSEGLDSTELTFRIEGEERTLNIPLPGTHNVMNALAAFAAGHALGLDIDTMIERFSNFKKMAMRFECVQLSNGVRLVNDSYNANPQSMKAAFRTVSAAKRAGRFIAVLGDMLELGEQASKLHEEVGRSVAKCGVQKLFIYGEHSADVASGAKAEGLRDADIVLADDVSGIGPMLLSYVNAGDVILVKGSRGMRMERVVDFLKREIGTG